MKFKFAKSKQYDIVDDGILGIVEVPDKFVISILNDKGEEVGHKLTGRIVIGDVRL